MKMCFWAKKLIFAPHPPTGTAGARTTQGLGRAGAQNEKFSPKKEQFLCLSTKLQNGVMLMSGFLGGGAVAELTESFPFTRTTEG